MFIVVAYYTPAYLEHVRKLVRSLDLFGMLYDVNCIPGEGSWVANCGYKPMFLLDMLEEHPDHDLLYVDADAVFRKYPDYFDRFTADVGCHIFDRQKWYGKPGIEYLSGTVFIRNNDAGRRFVEAWGAEQKKDRNQRDQESMAKVILAGDGFTFEGIPARYCQIFDTMADAGEPVIEHYQASRQGAGGKI